MKLTELRDLDVESMALHIKQEIRRLLGAPALYINMNLYPEEHGMHAYGTINFKIADLRNDDHELSAYLAEKAVRKVIISIWPRANINSHLNDAERMGHKGQSIFFNFQVADPV